MDASNYDEAYYQTGSERGTQYNDYLDQAPKNRTYYEIAQAIATIFKPKRALEIGCAAGIVVSHLDSFDIEAHGIDISDWAVANRFHLNVVNASADNLPFEDNFFDIVYSIHSLEHLPRELLTKSIQEMSRVCVGVQVHLMPMLESGPYVGDRFAHLLNLRTDPTHRLLFEKEWWREKFEEVGMEDLGVQIAFAHDSEYFELSACQIIMSKNDDCNTVRRIAQWNHNIAKILSQALNGRPTCGLDVHINRLKGHQS